MSLIARLAPLFITLPLLAEPMVGLTSTSALVGFDSAAPGTFTSGPTAITGVTAGYSVVAIERRPATGQLYALTLNFAAPGAEMQVYTLNDTTGVATALGSAFPAAQAIGASLSATTRFGFESDPVSDVLRVVSTGKDNFRVNPTTGAVAGTDTVLTPGGTQVAGAAYSNNVSGATSTTLYAIDTSTNPDQLVFIGGNPVPPGASPNGGVATLIGSLGVDTSAGDLGFEITASSGTAFAAMAVSGTSGLYTVNLGTGAASLIGAFQGGAIVTGLTSGVSIPPPPGEPMVGLTSTGALVGFDSAAPGTFTSGPTAITGVTAGYTVVAIERRPATGQLYALTLNFAAPGAEMQVYTVNETTGVAAALGSPFSAARAIGASLSASTRFGFDSDPVSDVLRVVSTGRDNFRVDPTTGAVVGSDTVLTPGGTQLPGAAYSNNVSGATSTTLYAIDVGANPDQLVIVGGNPVPPGASPNGGVTTTVGSLGPDTSAGDLGFEITSSGTAFAAMAVTGTSRLYTVDLGTGTASFIGTFQGGEVVTGLTSGPIVGNPNVSATKTASGTYVVGGTVTYTIVLSNSGNAAAPDNAGSDEFTDVLPVGLTLVSANASSGTAVATVPTRTVTWNGSIPAAGSVTITITATIDSGTGGTTLTNQGAFAYDADLNGTNETTGVTDDPGTGSAGDGTAIIVAGTALDVVNKSVSGTFFVGSTVTYTIVINNSGDSPSANNPGNELTDILPPQLTLVSANASSGTAVATVATNTVTWNGSVPAAGSVTITITATINNVPAGTPVSNQATHSYDSDTNGTNDAIVLSNDPGTATPNDPTIFLVAAAPAAIPALSGLGLVLLALGMALVAAKVMKG